MIKFFRTIRQNLIMENKTSKYLKYAIGEIVLVVIGILIALSLNNWNEHRKENLKETKLVEQLLNDAREDSIFFESRISIQKLRDTLFDNFISLHDNKSVDSISNLNIHSEYIFFFRLAFQSNLINNNPTAYNLISDEPIKNKLREYIKWHDYIVNSIELNNRICEQYGVELQIEYDEFIRQLPDSPKYRDYEFAYSDKEIISKFNVFKFYGTVYLEQCQEFLKVNNELIRMLELYLKENK